MINNNVDIQTHHTHTITCKDSMITGRVFRALVRKCNEIKYIDNRGITKSSAYFYRHNKLIISINQCHLTAPTSITLDVYFNDAFDDVYDFSLPDFEEDLFDIIWDTGDE